MELDLCVSVRLGVLKVTHWKIQVKQNESCKHVHDVLYQTAQYIVTKQVSSCARCLHFGTATCHR